MYTKPSRERGCVEVLDGCAQPKQRAQAISPLVRREEEGQKYREGRRKISQR
jgi:hypothetical protein